MRSSISKSVVLGLAAARAVHAHSQFTGLYVNGVGMGDATGIRMSPVTGAEGDPIKGITSNDMACNVKGETGVARILNIKATDTLTFEWRSWPDEPTKVPIDDSHKGPCSVYMKKVDDPLTDPGYGDGWFKIWHEGYDQATQKWCVDKLDSDRAHISVKLPANILGGYYLIRPEILALHAAAPPDNDPQFYTGCAQVFIDSYGDQVPVKTVSIPGYVTAKDSGVAYNIYAKSLSLPYPIPGPAIATFKSGGNGRGLTAGDQTKGLRPANCVMVAGNLCLTELPAYTTNDGCWAATKNCYSQNENCWKTAGLAAMHYCQFWETNKCKKQEALCNSNQNSGPPNRGQDITPKPSSMAVAGVVAAVAASQPTAAASSSSGNDSGDNDAASSTTTSHKTSDSSDDEDDNNDNAKDVEAASVDDSTSTASIADAGDGSGDSSADATGDKSTDDSENGPAEDDSNKDDSDSEPSPSRTQPAGADKTKTPSASAHPHGNRRQGRKHKSACRNRSAEAKRSKVPEMYRS